MGEKPQLLYINYSGADYFIDENGCLNRRAFKREGNAFVEYHELLLNGGIEAKQEITFDNGQDQERHLSLVFHHMSGKLLSARIPMKDVTSGNILSQFGIDARPAIGQQKKAYITDSVLVQAPHVQRLTVYQQTGYRNGMFLHAGGAIGADDITVEMQGRNVNLFFPDSESPGKHKTVMKFIDVASRAITLPLLALAFLSPLNEAFRRAGYEPSFLLMLLGVTGSMKSTLAALTLNFFGENWNNKNLPHSFKDTANALEKSLFLLADVLTVIDDLHPAGSRIEAAKMAATFQAVSHSVGDRTGRQRMNADSSLRRSYAPRGNVIITGEDFPDIGQSGTARNIVIELKKGDVDIKTLSGVQANTKHLAEVMRDYIKRLLPQYNKLPEVLKKRFLALREQAQSVGHGRTAEAIAHLQIGIEAFQNTCTKRERSPKKSAILYGKKAGKHLPNWPRIRTDAYNRISQPCFSVWP